MGADLLIAAVWIDPEKGADWDGLKKRIKESTLSELKDVTLYTEDEKLDGDDAYLAYVKETLLEYTEAIRKYITGEDWARDITTMRIGKYMVLITGGMSWGESPTEFSDAIWEFGNIPFLNEYGVCPE